MRALGIQDVTPIHQPAKDVNQSLLRRILKFKVFVICLSFMLCGILLLVFSLVLPSPPAPESAHQVLDLIEHLLRDIGIVLLTTGLVVFAADYMTRKEFIA